MRRAWWFIAFSLLLGQSATAQLDESIIRRLNEDIPNCRNVSYNAQLLIAGFYEENQMDSIEEVFRYWMEKCPGSSPMHHLGIILAIGNDAFDEQDFPHLLQSLIDYRSQKENAEVDYYYYWGEPRIEDYYDFLETIAHDFLKKPDLEPIEQDVLRFYATDYESLTDMFAEPQMAGTELQRQYNQKLRELRYRDEMYGGLFGGWWNPLDNLTQLGGHPELGFLFGIYHQKMHYNFTVGFRFLDAPQNYRALINDSIYSTDNYFGTYLGLEASRSIYKDFKNDIEIGAGIAYDGITVVHSDEEAGVEGVYLESFNFNIGAGYRFYYDFKNFLKLDLRYHFLNYRNGINDDFAGDAVTLRLIWGFSDNSDKRRQLRNLGY